MLGDEAAQVTALVAVDEEASAQVRLMNGIDRAPMSVRSVRENALELVGSLFLPRGCQVEVNLRCDAGFGSADDLPLRTLQLTGSVQKVAMIDSKPTYVLRVSVPDDRAGALIRLRTALEA